MPVDNREHEPIEGLEKGNLLLRINHFKQGLSHCLKRFLRDLVNRIVMGMPLWKKSFGVPVVDNVDHRNTGEGIDVEMVIDNPFRGGFCEVGVVSETGSGIPDFFNHNRSEFQRPDLLSGKRRLLLQPCLG